MNNTAVALPISNMNDLVQIGTMMSKTQLFGTNNANEAAMIAVMAYQNGMTFVEWMEKYHLIKGRVSMRADAMLAAFRKEGGTYTIEKRDPDGCVIHFSYKGTEYTSRCIWEEVKGEQFAQSQNYATPRKRMQMLSARAISDGVRIVAPQCVAGYYTPEEVVDFDDAPAAPKVIRVEAPAAPKSKVKELAPPKETAVIDAPVADVVAEEVVIDGEAMPMPKAEIDYSVCPIPGKALGKPWAEMPDAHLQKALTIDNLVMTDGHREYITQVLQTRHDEENV